ncbi:MAG: hypothetical protein HW374_426, partial [Bacteroidetes bacterium]|nr:hypothetical protein [Bacteroidota bacterium]
DAHQDKITKPDLIAEASHCIKNLSHFRGKGNLGNLVFPGKNGYLLAADDFQTS